MANFDDRRADTGAIWAALPNAGKGFDGALPYTTFVNRPLANYVVVIAYVIGVTPNQLSYLSFSLSLLGLIGLAVGPTANVWFCVACVLTLLVAYVIDSADGRLSRVTKTSSAYGEWLDHSMDMIKTVLIHVCCAYLIYEIAAVQGAIVFLVLAIGASAVVGQFFSTLLREKLVKLSSRPATTGATERSTSLLRAILLAPFDYGVFCFIFLLLPLPQMFAYVYFAWVGGATLRFLGSLVQSNRILRRLEGAQAQ